MVIDLDTPGGSVQYMLEMSKILTNDLKDIRTVAFVNSWAIIALSCDEIYMAPGSSIGAAKPITATGQDLPGEVKEKYESVLRAEARNLAERQGINQDMTEGIITQSVVVWIIRNRQTGELRFFNPRSDLGMTADPAASEAVKESERPERPPLAEGWEYLRSVVRSDQLLTMTASEATFYGLAQAIVEDRAELADRFNVLGEMVYMEDTLHEKVAAFLTSGWMTALLILVAIAGVYIEINTPGIGVPAAVAAAAFAVLLGAHFMMGLANWVEVVIFLLGVILLIVEIFVIPGFGVAGIAGIALMVGALLAMVVPNPTWQMPIPSGDLAWETFRTGSMAMLIGFIGSVFAIIGLSKVLPKTPIFNQIFLKEPEPFAQPPASDASPILHIKAGDAGVVASVCRPVGQVRIGEELIDAVANGAMIERGAHVRVIRNEGNRIVVERA